MSGARRRAKHCVGAPADIECFAGRRRFNTSARRKVGLRVCLAGIAKSSSREGYKLYRC
jgi:hypothetical protein